MFTETMELPITLSLLCSKLSKKLDRTLSAHGIGFTEFLVLHQLCASPNGVMSRVELSEAVSMTASGVTRLLLPMEKNHLVQREKNERDARVSLVRPTETGVAVYNDALVSYKHAVEALTKPLSLDDIATVRELLERL